MTSGPLHFTAVRRIGQLVLLLDFLAAGAAIALAGVRFWNQRNFDDGQALTLLTAAVRRRARRVPFFRSSGRRA